MQCRIPSVSLHCCTVHLLLLLTIYYIGDTLIRVSLWCETVLDAHRCEWVQYYKRLCAVCAAQSLFTYHFCAVQPLRVIFLDFSLHYIYTCAFVCLCAIFLLVCRDPTFLAFLSSFWMFCNSRSLEWKISLQSQITWLFCHYKLHISIVNINNSTSSTTAALCELCCVIWKWDNVIRGAPKSDACILAHVSHYSGQQQQQRQHLHAMY